MTIKKYIKISQLRIYLVELKKPMPPVFHHITSDKSGILSRIGPREAKKTKN
jgi:hypothetical protein